MTTDEPEPELPPQRTDIVGSLSPSRASDFMSCPLRYRYRVIDKLPEPPSPVAVRGTLVHSVLEHLYDRPAAERTLPAATSTVEAEWAALQEEAPGLAAMFDDDAELATWLGQARDLLGIYFDLEDPTRLEPTERELYIEYVLDSKLLLRGYIDRVDVAPTGEIRIVDYKTGGAPSEAFEGKALFQMKFYALVLWKLRGTIPALLQLMYLKNSEVLRYVPDEADLLATQRKIEALWKAIDTATRTGRWEARKGPLCAWCHFQEICPAWGGTPPPLPTAAADPN